MTILHKLSLSVKFLGASSHIYALCKIHLGLQQPNATMAAGQIYTLYANGSWNGLCNELLLFALSIKPHKPKNCWFANRADLDEAAHIETSHLNLCFYPVVFAFLVHWMTQFFKFRSHEFCHLLFIGALRINYTKWKKETTVLWTLIFQCLISLHLFNIMAASIITKVAEQMLKPKIRLLWKDEGLYH